MRHSSTQYRVKFYDSFPDKIALATIIKGEELYARALLWRLDNGRVYMDRIYSVNEQSKHLLQKYASEHKMLSFNRPRNKKERINITLKGTWKTSLPYFDSVCLESTSSDYIKLFVYV